MKKSKLLYLSFLTFSFVILVVSYLLIQSTQADETVYNVDISTSPANGFLIAKNLAPGDKKTSILHVYNNGNLDFNYNVTSRQESGDINLYHKIILTVSDSQGLLYQGSLSGLSQFPLGTIVKAESKTLTFIAELPIDSGNEYQGKTATVAFDFTAVGHEEQLPIGDGCFEPPFSNRNFTLHQKSTVPIKFHLRDSSGNFDDHFHDNVRLEITGPSVSGGTVNYEFTTQNGTLKFNQEVDEPHYEVRFSTWDYPVKTDGLYKATIYAGTKAVCQQEFYVLKQGNRSNAP
jgi:hypothetical protein